jgi:RNA polymerase sigma factor (sigma-70 family)
MPAAQLKVDEVLLPLLRVSNDSELQGVLAQIVSEHVTPVIRNIISHKLRLSKHAAKGSGDSDAEDIYHDVLVQLLSRLKDFRADPQQRTIGHLRSYVAVTAYNSCYRHLRQAYPQRHILKNRLRYLLNHQAGFGIWESDDHELACGFAAWREGRKAASSDKIKQLSDDPHALIRAAAIEIRAGQNNPAEALAAVFEYLGGPIKLDALVTIMAGLWGIKDQTSSLNEDPDAIGQLPALQTDIDSEIDRREYLRNLWAEITQLPFRQRAALLLNLRDGEGRGCIELFHLAGVATFIQIAGTLEISLEQFTALWNDLPLDDLAIADRLELTRQQVINLRKSARSRLARRMNFQQAADW